MILEILENKRDLSALEQEIADYILLQGEEMSYLSIGELAKNTYSSNASIIRLCRKCGCKGYKDFKVKFVKELKESESLMYLDVNKPFYQGDGANKIMNAIAALYNKSITSCIQSIDIHQLEKIANALLKADHIFIYGFGDTSIRAKGFVNKLYKLHKYCIIATDNNEQRAISYTTSSNDIALFLTYRGGNESFFQCVDILKKNQTPIVSITSKVDTYLTGNSIYTIQIPSDETDVDNIGRFYSQISFEFILDTLYSLMYAKNYSRNHKLKRNIDQNEEKV